MDAGLQIYNEDGALQLDSNSPILCLRYKYVYTKANYPGQPQVTLTFNAYRPVVAFYIASIPKVTTTAGTVSISDFYLKDNGNGTWTCAFKSAAAFFGFELSVYVFDLASAIGIGSANYGLQVFDANGNLIYGSEYFPFRMVYYSKPGAATLNNPYTGSGGVNGYASQNDLNPGWTVTPPANAAGIKCAVVYTSSRFGWQDDGGDIEGIVEILLLRDNKTELSYMYDGSSGPSSGGTGSYLQFMYPPYLWFIDVTNY